MANGTYVERGRALSKRYADDADDSSSDDEDEALAAHDGPTDNLSPGKAADARFACAKCDNF